MFNFAKNIQRSNVLLGALNAFFALAILVLVAPQPLLAQQQDAAELVPPRIGMVNGQASFWRLGAKDWSPAQVNTPLATGDALYTADRATLEVQIGSRAYLRMAQMAMVSLVSDEPEVMQFKITSGTVAFDLRSLPADLTIELDTPSGAFEISSAGYYRIAVSDNATHFIVRRGGEASITLADGSSRRIAPSQEVVVETGDGQGDVDTYVAPDADSWDDWNYARTDSLIDAISNRYVSPEVYGTDDLDHYGNWRVTPDYGPVWVPSGVTSDWAPYSSGSWMWDPVYSWTWVDTAPWGWAPYHYGRWISLNGFWAWAPGPRHNRPAYAPALVVFFHQGGTSVQIGAGSPFGNPFGTPGVSWVALGWGEPCLPWWGRREFVGKPWWGGWNGPRVVNNVVIQRNTVINNVNIRNETYRNLHQHNALIGVQERDFGHGRVRGETHFRDEQINQLSPIIGQHPVRPGPASLAPTEARAIAPAPGIEHRPSVAVRNPLQHQQTWPAERHDRSQAEQTQPESRVITVRPQTQTQAPPQSRPQIQMQTQTQIQTREQAPWARFGQSTGPERNEPRHPPEPPRTDVVPPQAAPPLRQNNNEHRRSPEQPRFENVTPPASPPAQLEINTTKPYVQEAPRPMPREWQRQAPVQSVNVPQQAPAVIHREAPPPAATVAPPTLMAPQQVIRSMPQREQMPERPRPEPAQVQQREPRQEHREWSRENRQQETPAALPGQPANRVYQRHDQRPEQQGN